MKCGFRDDTGRQCRKPVLCEAVLWGDSQLNPGWFWVAVCKTHLPRNALFRRPSDPTPSEGESK